MKEEYDSFRHGKVYDKYFHLLISFRDVLKLLLMMETKSVS